jgi:hypothetical protein
LRWGEGRGRQDRKRASNPLHEGPDDERAYGLRWRLPAHRHLLRPLRPADRATRPPGDQGRRGRVPADCDGGVAAKYARLPGLWSEREQPRSPERAPGRRPSFAPSRTGRMAQAGLGLRGPGVPDQGVHRAARSGRSGARDGGDPSAPLGDGLVLEAPASWSDRAASGCRAGLPGDHDGRPDTRRRRPGPRRRLPHRPRLDLHRREIHRPVPATGDPPVDGPGRLVLRQCRRRSVLPPAWSGRSSPGTSSPRSLPRGRP